MKQYFRFIPAILWMMVIYYFSSRNTSGVPIVHDLQFYFFKSLHLIEYSILGFLLFFAFVNFKISLVIGYIYAITDEIHQLFVVGRSGKFTDTLFDIAGILIGLYIYKYIQKKFKNRL